MMKLKPVRCFECVVHEIAGIVLCPLHASVHELTEELQAYRNEGLPCEYCKNPVHGPGEGFCCDEAAK